MKMVTYAFHKLRSLQIINNLTFCVRQNLVGYVWIHEVDNNVK